MTRNSTARVVKGDRAAGNRAKGRSRGRRVQLGMVLAVVATAGIAVVFILFPRGQGQPRGADGGLTGQEAPAFTLNSTAGVPVSLASYRGKKNVLLYWYEHAG